MSRPRSMPCSKPKLLPEAPPARARQPPCIVNRHRARLPPPRPSLGYITRATDGSRGAHDRRPRGSLTQLACPRLAVNVGSVASTRAFSRRNLTRFGLIRARRSRPR